MRRKQGWAQRVKKERFRKRYLSKAQATRLLQLDSMGFRRICILKGIYPRAIAGKSKQKQSGDNKQYYLSKEIKWLVHDHVRARMAAYTAFEKKIKSAKAMHRFDQLTRLEDHSKPSYNLAASLRERYPTFAMAMKDVDDALSTIAMYAAMSPEIKSESTIEFHHALPSGLHRKAHTILQDWMNFIVETKSLKRTFISIKGYYYEAEVRGDKIVWLMPHEYAQKFPQGVQQYVLITFLEFQCELLRFALFKLKADRMKEIAAAEKAADEEAANVDAGDDAVDAAEDFDETVAEELRDDTVGKNKVAVDLKKENKIQGNVIASLFSRFVFFVSREVPFKHAKLVIESCGGTVVKNFGPKVTHYVIDRPAPLPPHTTQANVEYIQPQYLFDCLNARMVLPVHGYRMGEELPAHVSPFTVAISGSTADQAAVDELIKMNTRIVSHVPDRVHEIRKLKDPGYVPTDADAKYLPSDDDEGADSEDDDAALSRMQMDIEGDDVALDDDEIAIANKRKAWADEEILERPERTKAAAFKVQKQRELNLMNQPTDTSVAVSRRMKEEKVASRRSKETPEARRIRKEREATIEEKAELRARRTVARGKQRVMFNMANSSVKKRALVQKSLKEKAAIIKKGGATISKDGKQFDTNKSKHAQKRFAKADPATQRRMNAKKNNAANPYKHLPKHVR